jgi:Tfp pilus assembly protein PilF
MRSLLNVLAMCFVLFGLTACGSTKLVSCSDGRDPIWFGSASQRMLENGTYSYGQGNYSVAMMRLQGVIDFPTAAIDEKVEAYKLMAFIHCISGREKMCSDSFKKAIQLDPKFELTPAEVGHPVWGPVFRSLKK